MPGATFQREATAWRDSSQKMLDLPFQEVREKMVRFMRLLVLFAYIPHIRQTELLRHVLLLPSLIRGLVLNKT